MLNEKLFFQPYPTQAAKEDKELVFKRILAEQGSIGYYELPTKQVELVEKIKEFVSSNKPIFNKKVENLVIIGIGGSTLGTRAVDTALNHLDGRNQKINLIFLENCDPIGVEKLLKDVKLKNTVFVMVSKSGSTIETTTIVKYIISKYDLDLSSKKVRQRFFIITDENSPLDAFAKEHSLSAFYIHPNVGGRFSILSAVGLLPLAILGYDIEKLLSGAEKMRDSFFANNQQELLETAITLAKNHATHPITVLFSYASELASLSAWFVQLWAESLGKITEDGKKVGLTPVGLTGSIDQHSFLQLIVQGQENKSVVFIKVADFGKDCVIPQVTLKNLEKTDFVNGNQLQTLLNAQCDATLETLVELKIPSALLTLDRLDEESVGALLFYFELLTSCAGAYFNINTYDQPGVEFGKQRLATKFSK